MLVDRQVHDLRLGLEAAPGRLCIQAGLGEPLPQPEIDVGPGESRLSSGSVNADTRLASGQPEPLRTTRKPTAATVTHDLPLVCRVVRAFQAAWSSEPFEFWDNDRPAC